tara:strand:+ start:2885 stop:3517 length:633 start_codon:yes stop_codon:yes gene_type:complete
MYKKNKKYSVILNGNFPKESSLLKMINDSEFIIAVDGAANKLIDLEIIPDVIIGDFDSFQATRIKRIKLVETSDQNKTDFRKTLDWCIEKNILNISIFGISGESEDHFLGNYYTLNDFSNKIEWIAFTDFSIIKPCIRKKEFESYKGQKVSLFSMKGDTLVSSKNLEYPLDSYLLTPSDNAVRNISISNKFIIESSNNILVFQSRKQIIG